MILKFLRDPGGNFLTIVAIVSPVLLGVAGLALDVGTYVSQQSRMQETADSAVLAAIREAAVAGWDPSVATAVVKDFIATQLETAAFTQTAYNDSVEVDPASNRIKVTIQQNGHGYLLLSLWKNNPQIEVTAEAHVAIAANICVLTLEKTAGNTVGVNGTSKLTGRDCGVFANSIDVQAIIVEPGSSIAASNICTAGGYKGPRGNYNPVPVTDCPPIADPLADRDPPPVGSCNYYDTVMGASGTLSPGVYCGGLRISSGTATLKPGIYVIKDGEFEISGNTSLVGKNVGFYFTGNTARTRFNNSTTISLTAPKDGPMAGILFFEDRASAKGREFEISSKNAQMLLGTIYLPNGYLAIRGVSKFANAADWTAIIAKKVLVANGPVVVLNSDYKASDIPVPNGISAETSKISLVK